MASFSTVAFVGSKHPQLRHVVILSFFFCSICFLGLGSILEMTASKHLVAPGVPFPSKLFVLTQIYEEVRLQR